jgi:hypothetical protein
MTWNQNRLSEKLGIDYPIISVFLNSLVEEVSEIAGPLNEWSARRREKK